MTIKVGDKVPSVTLRYVGPEGVKAVTTEEFFGGKKVVLFGLPGAYTRTCSQRHLPSYVTHAAELRAKGVDTIACLSANDHFVMGAWGKEHGADDKVVMLGDGSGDFLGLEGVAVPREYADLFTAIPRAAFYLPISSTDLRSREQEKLALRNRLDMDS